MGSFIFAIIFTVAALATLFFRKHLTFVVQRGYQGEEPVTANPGAALTFLFSVLALLLFANSFLTQTEEGTRKVVKTFGRASDTALEPGLDVILPWQNTVPISVRAEVFQQTYPCQSNDLQRMDISIATIYQRDPNKVAEIYKDVMLDSRDRTVKPAAKQISKAQASEFDAPDLIANRTQFSRNIYVEMDKWLADYNLVMLADSVANIDFEPAYDKKVEKKVIELEQAQMATHDLRAERAKAQIERFKQLGAGLSAKQKARGDSESTRILGDAEAYATETLALAKAYRERAIRNAEASRARLISQALSDGQEVIVFETVRKWDGTVPRFLAPTENQKDSPYGFLAQVPQLKKHDVTADDLAGQGESLDKRVEDFIKSLQERDAQEAQPQEEKVDPDAGPNVDIPAPDAK